VLVHPVGALAALTKQRNGDPTIVTHVHHGTKDGPVPAPIGATRLNHRSGESPTGAADVYPRRHPHASRIVVSRSSSRRVHDRKMDGALPRLASPPWGLMPARGPTGAESR
jgi:hypothetical protein